MLLLWCAARGVGVFYNEIKKASYLFGYGAFLYAQVRIEKITAKAVYAPHAASREMFLVIREKFGLMCSARSE